MSITKSYETVFILTPVLSEEQAREAVDSYRKLIKEHEGKIVNEEHWGLRKLAYPIQKKSTGFYHVLQFTAPTSLITELEITYQRDERILRYLTISLDKHALAYLVKRKERFGKKEPKKETTAI